MNTFQNVIYKKGNHNGLKVRHNNWKVWKQFAKSYLYVSLPCMTALKKIDNDCVLLSYLITVKNIKKIFFLMQQYATMLKSVLLT